MLIQFIAIALGTLVSEDLACIAAGVLAAQGKMSFIEAVIASLAGIVLGDILLFAIGRYAGSRVLTYSFVQKRLPLDKVELASEWLRRHGSKVIILSRFTPGMRLPIYVTAGILRANAGRMVTLFLIAAALWTPILVGTAAFFGRQVIEHALSLLRGGALAIVVVFVAAWFLKCAAALVVDRKRLLVLKGAVLRRLQWEFLPAWIAYIPIGIYIVYLALKYRSATLFTAANPGIFSGGLCGESKSAILEHLAPSGRVPCYTLLQRGAGPFASLRTIVDFMNEQGLRFPIVLKPDIGERGEGVAVIRSMQAATNYFTAHDADTIVQEYVPGLEFGIFYARKPNEERGRILSIAHKQFPVVEGDGHLTIEDLILGDKRAVCIAGTYLRQFGASASRVPAAGETVQLVELGSHCRGAIFLNGMHLSTDALECEIDRISKAHAGFYFGRFDVRCDSIRDLQTGNIRIIELNGVAGEPAHVYDPAVGIIEAYRVMLRHWALAFETGSANRNRGARPMALRDLIAVVRSQCRGDHPSAAPLAVEIPSTSSGAR